MRPTTLFTGQWADLPLAELLPKVKEMGYDGVELACWGDHFDVDKALEYREKVKAVRKGMAKPKLMIRAPVIVEVIRASAYQHIKAMDKRLDILMGVGLETFQVHATDWSTPLRAALQERVIQISEGRLISVCNVPLPVVTPMPRTLVYTLTKDLQHSQ